MNRAHAYYLLQGSIDQGLKVAGWVVPSSFENHTDLGEVDNTPLFMTISKADLPFLRLRLSRCKKELG